MSSPTTPLDARMQVRTNEKNAAHACVSCRYSHITVIEPSERHGDPCHTALRRAPASGEDTRAPSSDRPGGAARLRVLGAPAVVHACCRRAQPHAVVDQPTGQRARTPDRQEAVHAPHAGTRADRRRRAPVRDRQGRARQHRPHGRRDPRCRRPAARHADDLCVVRLAVARAAAARVPARASRHRHPHRRLGPHGRHQRGGPRHRDPLVAAWLCRFRRMRIWSPKRRPMLR